MDPVSRGNFAGFAAILLWSSSALLLSYCVSVPRPLLVAIASFVGFAVFFLKWLFFKENIRQHFRISKKIILFAAVGIGGYQLLYFMAFQHVPPVEASLVNYMWPIFVVLFSGFLPEENLKMRHIIGVFIGVTGLVVLLSPGQREFSGLSLGHLFALLGAIEWAGFSVLSRRTKNYSSHVIPISFLLSGMFFLLIYILTAEPFQIPVSGFFAALVLGLFSSLGYFFWDVGMKQGNIQFLGTSSFFIPLLSTALLILFQQAEARPAVIIATLLIFAGAVVTGKSQKKLRTMPVD